MNYISTFFLFCMLFTPLELMSFNILTNYSKQKPEQNVQDLTVEQINNPTDPYVNYNLGVALYQSDKFDQAKNNFQRSLIHAKNNTFKEHCYFNLGNSFYKNGISGLPLNWQDKDTEVDQTKLGQAVQEIQEAIKNYESTLELNKENTHAKTNQEKAKTLLKKLQEKMKQQQQNQQNKNDKQDKNQDQDKDQQQNQNSQNSSSDRKESNSQQNQQQQPAQDKKDSSGKPCDNGENGYQEKSEQEKNSNKEQQDFKHDQTQSEQQKEKQQNNQDNGSQQEQQNQEQAKEIAAVAMQPDDSKQDSAKQKSIRAMLDNLQNYESNLQKARVAQKAQENNEPLKSNQKPW